MNEYIKHSNDIALARENFAVLCGITDAFINRITPCGLVTAFDGYWNFYEWSEGMAGGGNETEPEAPLNAFLVLALEAMTEICAQTGEPHERYGKYANSIRRALRDRFFNEEIRLFESYTDRCRGKFSVLTNALCLLCGAADECDRSTILRVVAENGDDGLGITVIPCTLSMNSFRFDALLRENAAEYSKLILSKIDSAYSKMLSRGATTFWETERGADDFSGAGSLCHGWSALPVYYYSVLL